MSDNNSRDLVKLQENLYQMLNEHETKILEKLTSYFDKNDKRLLNHERSFEEFETRIASHQNTLSENKVLIDKIPSILKNTETNNEDIFTHQRKILTLQKDVSSACAKYDKIFLENLIVPGVIGDGCFYPNVREFIQVS